MHWAGTTAIALVVGAAAGVAVGKLSGGVAHPGEPPALPGVEVAAPSEHAAPLFASETPSEAPVAATAATVGSGQPGPAPGEQAVARAMAEKPPNEILVLPHGPGHFARVDLAAAGLSSLPIYAGTMTRDGPAQLTSIQRAAKVGTLRGPQAEFEWLHAGFDRDARLVAAHIRLPDGGVEGVVVLLVTRKGQPEVLLPLRPDLSRRAEPAPSAAVPGPP
ncbi:MAG: hypothetical protein HY902_18200 [Deltaproteobacteria bacterium]|nr:hypothetical protein [Deltaproteobacteria bacterium]